MKAKAIPVKNHNVGEQLTITGVITKIIHPDLNPQGQYQYRLSVNNKSIWLSDADIIAACEKQDLNGGVNENYIS